MLKLTSLALGLLTVIAIAPKSEAMSVNSRPLSVQQPAVNLHSQIIFKIGGQQEYHRRGGEERRREIEREREREREREIRRHQQYRGHHEYRGEHHDR